MKNDLNKAVQQCIDAVGYEFDTDVQKLLIRVKVFLKINTVIINFVFLSKAAQFGKCFIPDVNSDKYVHMCRLLRVLNAIRHPKIGLPLTFTQYPFLCSNKKFPTKNEP